MGSDVLPGYRSEYYPRVPGYPCLPLSVGIGLDVPSHNPPQSNQAGTTATTRSSTRLVGDGICTTCGGTMEEEFTACGIFFAIVFFPLGILCCLEMKEKRCSNCGLANTAHTYVPVSGGERLPPPVHPPPQYGSLVHHHHDPFHHQRGMDPFPPAPAPTPLQPPHPFHHHGHDSHHHIHPHNPHHHPHHPHHHPAHHQGHHHANHHGSNHGHHHHGFQ